VQQPATMARSSVEYRRIFLQQMMTMFLILFFIDGAFLIIGSFLVFLGVSTLLFMGRSITVSAETFTTVDGLVIGNS
jgi:hypothetical protein